MTRFPRPIKVLESPANEHSSVHRHRKPSLVEHKGAHVRYQGIFCEQHGWETATSRVPFCAAEGGGKRTWPNSPPQPPPPLPHSFFPDSHAPTPGSMGTWPPRPPESTRLAVIHVFVIRLGGVKSAFPMCWAKTESGVFTAIICRRADQSPENSPPSPAPLRTLLSKHDFALFALDYRSH